MTARVVLVDDQELVRVGFRMVLETRPDIEVVGEADDGDTAIELLSSTAADIVLMDVRMPRLDGVEATARIRSMADAPRVIILTTFDLDEYVYDALLAGASGFLLKDTPIDDIAAAIAHVHDGDAVVAPSTTRRLLEHFTASRPSPANDVTASAAAVLDALTPREIEVFHLLARGLSNAEIAAELVLTEGTAKVHVGRILNKLGLRDRVRAVVLAYETGIVSPGSA